MMEKQFQIQCRDGTEHIPTSLLVYVDICSDIYLLFPPFFQLLFDSF